MLTQRQHTENDLKQAQATLQGRVKLLTDKQLDEKQRKRDIQFRQATAAIRQFQRRLKAMDKIDAVNADLVVRRAERAEKAKLPKVKKKKVVAAPVKKGGGGGKKEKKAAAGAAG